MKHNMVAIRNWSRGRTGMTSSNAKNQWALGKLAPCWKRNPIHSSVAASKELVIDTLIGSRLKDIREHRGPMNAGKMGSGSIPYRHVRKKSSEWRHFTVRTNERSDKPTPLTAALFDPPKNSSNSKSNGGSAGTDQQNALWLRIRNPRAGRPMNALETVPASCGASKSESVGRLHFVAPDDGEVGELERRFGSLGAFQSARHQVAAVEVGPRDVARQRQLEVRLGHGALEGAHDVHLAQARVHHFALRRAPKSKQRISFILLSMRPTIASLYLVLPRFSRLFSVFTRHYWVLPSFTG